MRKPTVTQAIKQALRFQSPMQRKRWEQARMSVCPLCDAQPDAPCTMKLTGSNEPLTVAHHAARYDVKGGKDAA